LHVVPCLGNLEAVRVAVDEPHRALLAGSGPVRCPGPHREWPDVDSAYDTMVSFFNALVEISVLAGEWPTLPPLLPVTGGAHLVLLRVFNVTVDSVVCTSTVGKPRKPRMAPTAVSDGTSGIMPAGPADLRRTIWSSATTAAAKCKGSFMRQIVSGVAGTAGR